MKRFFRQLFNIYSGEEKNALLFGLLGFLWALAVTSGQKFSDALFLLHIGAESLPIAYMCTAFGMFFIAAFLIRAFDRISIHRIFMSVLSIGIVFYCFAFLCLWFDLGTAKGWLWFALRIFGSTFFAVVVTCYWTFIDQYHHLQVAKRLYSLFTSMIFLGIAATGAIMRSGLFDFQHIILGIVVVLFICIYWIGKISKIATPVSEWTDDEGSAFPNFTFRYLVESIIRSRFTLLLMSANFLTYVLLVLTEYNYLSSFDQHFDPGQTVNVGDEEEASLTLFLGQAIAFVSVSNLIFGLFIYSRLVRRFGSSSLVIITPAILLFTYAGWPLSQSLFFPLLGFMVVEGTLYVIDDSNFNLLLNAVPSKLKYKIRVIIESFFEPIGMLASAIILSFTGENSKTLGLLLSGILLCIALILRKRYFKAIYLNLTENAIQFQKPLIEWFEKMSPKDYRQAEYRLLNLFKQGDEASQILALNALMTLEDEAYLQKIIPQINHHSSAIKLKFLEIIGKTSLAQESHVLDLIHQWIRQESDPVFKSSLAFYLASQGFYHPEKAYHDLKSFDSTLKGAAIVALKKSWAQLSPHQLVFNRTLAAQYLEELLNSEREEDICMGIKVLELDASANDMEMILSFLKNPSPKISQAAAQALVEIADKDCVRYAPQVLSQLLESKDLDFRIACLKSLGKMADSSFAKNLISSSLHFRPQERRLVESIIVDIGLRTVPTLLALVKDTSLPDRCRLLAGKILGRLALPQLRVNLEEILSKEISRAYFYFYYHHSIQERYPEYDLSLLQDALLATFHSILDFIIQILGVAGEIEDVELLSRSIRSKNPKIRSQVVETLEKTCEPAIYRLLFPLVSDAPVEEKIHAYLRQSPPLLSFPELLDKMSDSPSQLDQIVAATFKHRYNFPNWRISLMRQMSNSDEIFHHFAYEMLEHEENDLN